MKHYYTSLGALISLIVLLWAQLLSAQTPAALPAAHDALLLVIENKVETAPAGSMTWTPARTNQILHVGDRLRTGLRSRVTVRLSNLTVLRVNELTTLQIQPPSAPGKQATLNLEKGAAYFFSRERPAEMEFRTPIASGAIRGTEFNLAVAGDDKTVVTLLDGEVALTNQSGGVNLISGDQGIVEPGQMPTKTAVINTINIIQWCLYYPAVLDVDELAFSGVEKQELAASLGAYRAGDLPAALAGYPANRVPGSDSEKIYYAGLLLSVGQVEPAEMQLQSVSSPLAKAPRLLIAAVKHELSPTNDVQLPTASEWLAKSYYFQSQSRLDAALGAARNSTGRSPNFGFAWGRLAELEFSFGHTDAALAALERSLQLSPRNAAALALKGFLLAAQNKISNAQKHFDAAIAVDGALGIAWLGRGLTRIRQHDLDGGLKDLQVAATLEPNRALLRSYLGKAFAGQFDLLRARKELALARTLDPNDPTAWLYLALLDQQANKINEAVRNLEKSKALNDNRSVFRSRLLLDQDQAVRSANLAKIYRDAGMTDVSVNEAARAVSRDYANYSAHQFLANSYDALRDPNQINLRYETPWFSELLLSQLLAPVGGGNLSQYVSQQEYSRLFERDHFGMSSSTEYRSDGSWHEEASQYGNVGNFGYAIDAEYRSQNGVRPNNDLEQRAFHIKAKQQLTPQDSLLLVAQIYDSHFGDVAQYYNPTNADRQVRLKETQSPNLFIGYHHEWSPGSHTLLLAGRLNDTLTQTNPAGIALTLRNNPDGSVATAIPRTFGLDQERELNAYSVELQHILKAKNHTFIGGVRYQSGEADTSVTLTRNPFSFPPIYSNPPAAQHFTPELNRFNIYGYDLWQIFEWLQLTLGVSYDQMSFPANSEVPPIRGDTEEKNSVSPKVGLMITPWQDATLRGVYTRSLGGVFYDQSVRLEPTMVAGFNQAFRSLIPESVAGLLPGTEFETFGLAFDQQLGRGTYFTISGEILRSDANRSLGVFDYSGTPPAVPGSTPENLKFEEQSLSVTLNQLLGNEWALGANYRISRAELHDRLLDIPVTVLPGADQHLNALLEQVNLYALYNHPGGFFARADALWSRQDNQGYSPAAPGDDFWQFNLYAGYRFYHRQAELRLGLLNIADQDYRLNPLNLYNELPRSRMLSVMFRFNF